MRNKTLAESSEKSMLFQGQVFHVVETAMHTKYVSQSNCYNMLEICFKIRRTL